MANTSRDIRLIAFDLDGTLIDQTIYIWSTLHSFFGTDPVKRKKAADNFFAGRITYREWFEHDIKILKKQGATKERILEAFLPLRIAPGAMETLAELEQRGYTLCVISGSIDLVVHHFFPKVPFKHILVNRLFFDPKGTLTGGQYTPYDIAEKASGLVELARRESLSIVQCAFVGDNVNDLEVMKIAGFSIGVHIKHPDVRDAADLVVEDPDLRSLLPLFPPLTDQ